MEKLFENTEQLDKSEQIIEKVKNAFDKTALGALTIATIVSAPILGEAKSKEDVERTPVEKIAVMIDGVGKEVKKMGECKDKMDGVASSDMSKTSTSNVRDHLPEEINKYLDNNGFSLENKNDYNDGNDGNVSEKLDNIEEGVKQGDVGKKHDVMRSLIEGTIQASKTVAGGALIMASLVAPPKNVIGERVSNESAFGKLSALVSDTIEETLDDKEKKENNNAEANALTDGNLDTKAEGKGPNPSGDLGELLDKMGYTVER